MEGVNVRHAVLLTSLKHVFNFTCTIKQNSTIRQKLPYMTAAFKKVKMKLWNILLK